MRRFAPAVLVALAALPAGRGQDADEAAEKAVKAAAAKVAPAVVAIQTAGGLDAVAGAKDPMGKTTFINRGTGPTTGVVVGSDGYVLTSSFNFANRPTDIFISAPGKGREVAEVVAADQSRMLTLLRVKKWDGLPVPAAVPKADVKIGQTAIALGRALDPNPDHPPGVSVGIVSAKNRLFGRALQADAKFSPANYGGPLVALDGRVLGVIVPASPQGEGETAGFEWYDSGVGFVIPFEDILARFPELKKGKDLRRGLLGFTPDPKVQPYAAPPVVAAVQPGSAAEKAGLAVGDTVVKVDDKAVPHYSALQHLLGPKYEGDTVTLTVRRDGMEVTLPPATLLGSAPSVAAAFLGVLPTRDAQPGVGVRYVYPDSGAAAAGIKEGDRIVKVAKAKVAVQVKDRAALAGALAGYAADTEITVDVIRKGGGATDVLKVKLGTVPETIPEKLPPPAAAARDLPVEFAAAQPKDPFAPKKKDGKAETGFLERTDANSGRQHWLFVPENYDPATPHGLLLWLHPPGAGGGRDGKKLADAYRQFCTDTHVILLGPKSAEAEGWLPSESDAVVEDVRRVQDTYKIDPARVAAHGMARGGQMAYHLGFNYRDLFRGVGTVGATLGTPPRDTVPTQPLSFFVAAGDKDASLKDVQAGAALLREKRYPVSERVMPGVGREYLDAAAMDRFQVWLDALDRL